MIRIIRRGRTELLVLALAGLLAACGGGHKETRTDVKPTGGGGDPGHTIAPSGGSGSSDESPTKVLTELMASAKYKEIFDQCDRWSKATPTSDQLLACASLMPPALYLAGHPKEGAELMGSACDSVQDKMSLVSVASFALLMPITQPGANADEVKATFAAGTQAFATACGLDPSEVFDAVKKMLN